MSTKDLDPSEFGETDRLEVDPPIEVETATWFAASILALINLSVYLITKRERRKPPEP